MFYAGPGSRILMILLLFLFLHHEHMLRDVRVMKQELIIQDVRMRASENIRAIWHVDLSAFQMDSMSPQDQFTLAEIIDNPWIAPSFVYGPCRDERGCPVVVTSSGVKVMQLPLEGEFLAEWLGVVYRLRVVAVECMPPEGRIFFYLGLADQSRGARISINSDDLQFALALDMSLTEVELVKRNFSL